MLIAKLFASWVKDDFWYEQLKYESERKQSSTTERINSCKLYFSAFKTVWKKKMFESSVMFLNNFIQRSDDAETHFFSSTLFIGKLITKYLEHIEKEDYHTCWKGCE